MALKLTHDSAQAALCVVRDGLAITGLAAGPFGEQTWEHLLSVGSEVVAEMFVVDVQAGARTARVRGRCELDHARHLAMFVPTMPMLRGESYRITFGGPATELADRLQLSLDLASVKERPSVLALYPSGATWPANTLRFYIEFSTAMAEEQLLEHVHLYDADGIEQPNVFLDTARELWSVDRRRLTVLFDPGRVKSGLRAHVELGRALRNGHSYRIEIDANFCAVSGLTLGTAYTKHFRVAEPFERIVAPHEWQWHEMQPDSCHPLQLAFPYPLDRAMLERSLEVIDECGNCVSGVATIDEGEQGWRFTPHENWRAQQYRLRVSTTLEDIAGNNLNELFEHVAAASTRFSTSISLPFPPTLQHASDAVL